MEAAVRKPFLNGGGGEKTFGVGDVYDNAHPPIYTTTNQSVGNNDNDNEQQQRFFLQEGGEYLI